MKWRGRELANPVVILLRLVSLPLIFLSRIALSASVFIGWGFDADSEWEAGFFLPADEDTAP